MELASFVVACAAAVGAFVALWYTRAQKKIAQDAARESRRSADAAAEVAKIERERREEERADADRNRVRFDLLPDGSETRYKLVQMGTESAFGVHVDAGDMAIGDDETDFAEFPSRGVVRINLVQSYGTKTDHVLVTWHHLPDQSDSARSVKLYGP